jgi:hypothetical protein
MEPVDAYADSADRLTRREFTEKFPMLFLIKRPSGAAASMGPITFRTQALTLNADGLLADNGPFIEGFWVWPLLKKRGNPFPDRISLGRANNCDVVFRLSYVSKLHAHVMLDDNHASIADQGSANGTEVNGQALAPHSVVKLEPGDTIKLGALELNLLDAGGLYDVLVREVIPHI